MLQSDGAFRRKKIRLIGFTLAEILVALALIALLAAVLLPTVAGQILKGDASRISQDLNGVRSGMEQFLADVHRYPGRYSHLSQSVTTGDLDANGTAYPNGLTKRWSGPYVTKDTSDGGYIESGFAARLIDPFLKMAYGNGTDYVTIRISQIAEADFNRVDATIDGTVDATKGILRWDNDTLRFFAIPIQ
jgi:prepilin-type N-terminal cleavage/methylation domain-containing protein